MGSTSGMRRLAATALTVVATATVASCTQASTDTPTASSPEVPPPAAAGGLPRDDPHAPLPAAQSCTMRHENGQPLPDPHCTPGAVDPAVTQSTINSTICKSGWTATVRPSTSVTNRIKKQIDLAYRLPTTTHGELDHLVSLELGGAPDDPRNLWVEPGSVPNPKDAVENQLHQAVCAGQFTLTAVQAAIAADWTTAEARLGLGNGE